MVRCGSPQVGATHNMSKKLKDSFYYQPYQLLEKRKTSFADFSKGKNYYNQLAFLFEEASSRNHHTEKETDFLIELTRKYLNVDRPRFLDIACGTGRHDRILTKEGFQIIGIDSSDSLLKIARQKDKKTLYKKADFRTFKLREKFDCIFSLWEAYNYLSQQKDIKAFFKQSCLHLKSGGVLVLDSRNFWRKEASLKKVQSRNFQTDDYDVDLIIRKQTLLKERVHEGIFMYFLTNKKSGHQNVIIDQELVRIFNLRELEQAAGTNFKLLRTFGDFDFKKSYNKQKSERMIVVFQKI